MGRGFRSPTDPGQTGGSCRKGHGLGSRVVAQSVGLRAGLLGGGSSPAVGIGACDLTSAPHVCPVKCIS